MPTASSAAESDRGTEDATSPEAAVPVVAEPQPGEVRPEDAGLTAPGAGTGTDPGTGPPGGTSRDKAVRPAESGAGRRVVFKETEQRVWFVRSDGTVRRTYLVSGSVEDNLEPGTCSVFSRSRWAVGLDDSGVMEFFVRFAHGQRAAIGFHTIPTRLGVALQSRAELGTP